MTHRSFSLRISAMLLLVLSSSCSTVTSDSIARIENYYPKPAEENMLPVKNGPAPEESVSPVPEQRALTLEHCVAIALDRNPLRKAAEEGIAVARANTNAVASQYYPSLTWSASYRRWESHAFLPSDLGLPGKKPSSIGPVSDWSTGLKAQYLIFDSGKRAAELRAAKSAVAAVSEEAEKLQQDIALSVHHAFYQLCAAREGYATAEQNKKRAEAHTALAARLWESGAVPKADVIRAQVDLSESALKLVQFETAVKEARVNLNRALGLPLEMEFALQTDMPVLTDPDTIDMNTAVGQALHQRPELKAALHLIDQQQHLLSGAESAFGPTVAASLGYGYRDDSFPVKDKDWSAGIGIELPIFDGFRRKNNVAKEKHAFARQEALLRQKVLEISEEIWVSKLHWAESFAAIALSEAIVHDAEESMRMIRERYEAGAATATDLLDGQSKLAGAQFGLVEAHWRFFAAKTRFDHACGNLVAASD